MYRTYRNKTINAYKGHKGEKITEGSSNVGRLNNADLSNLPTLIVYSIFSALPSWTEDFFPRK